MEVRPLAAGPCGRWFPACTVGASAGGVYCPKGQSQKLAASPTDQPDTLGPTTLHGAVAWFAGVAEFRVLETDPFTAQSTGEVMTNDVIEHLDPVVNVGVGIEHKFTPTFSGFGAFRTDNSPLPDSSAANSTLSRWDLAHVSAGVSFTINRLDLVVGTDLTFGGTKSRPPPSSTLPGDPVIPEDARVKYFAATLLIGFKVGFGAER